MDGGGRVGVVEIARGIVERQRALARPGRRAWRPPGRQAEMGQDSLRDERVFDGGDQLHATVAARAVQNVQAPTSLHERGPMHSSLSSGIVGRIGIDGRSDGAGVRRVRGGPRGGGGLVALATSGEGETSPCVGGEQTRVTDHVEPSRRHEGAQAQEQLARLEAQDVAAVAESTFQGVKDGAVGRFFEAALGQGRAQGIATQRFETLAILLVDGGGGVKGEAVLARAQGRKWLLDEGGARTPGRTGGEDQVGLGIVVDGVVVQTTLAAEHGGDAGDDPVE